MSKVDSHCCMKLYICYFDLSTLLNGIEYQNNLIFINLQSSLSCLNNLKHYSHVCIALCSYTINHWSLDYIVLCHHNFNNFFMLALQYFIKILIVLLCLQCYLLFKFQPLLSNHYYNFNHFFLVHYYLSL
jgi:hypothetical protein